MQVQDLLARGVHLGLADQRRARLSVHLRRVEVSRLEFEIWRYGKSEDWAAEYVPKVREVTASEANAALGKWLVPEKTRWIVIGDAKVVRPQLEEIGLPIEVLDRHGNPVADE